MEKYSYCSNIGWSVARKLASYNKLMTKPIQWMSYDLRENWTISVVMYNISCRKKKENQIHSYKYMKAMEVINVIEFDMEHFSQRKPNVLYGCFSIYYNRIQLVQHIWAHVWKYKSKICFTYLFEVGVGVCIDWKWEKLHWVESNIHNV